MRCGVFAAGKNRQRPGTWICWAGNLRGDGMESPEPPNFPAILSRKVTMHLSKSLEPNALR
jgi:hypothetical protein